MSTVAIVALVIALVLAVVVLIVVPLLCCLWCNTRKQVHVLKSRVSSMEYGQLTGKTTNSVQTSVPGDLPHSPPPPGSPTTSDDTKQLIPTLSTNRQPPGYSDVNMLGVLPDEVRTPENLEGSEIPSDQAKVVVEDYVRKTNEYEERVLQKPTKEVATPPPVDSPTQFKQPPTKHIPSHVPGYEDISGFTDEIKPPGPGYEDIPGPPPLPLSQSAPNGGNQYEDPRDAIHNNSEMLKNLKQGGSNSPPDKKKFHLADTPEGEDYTPVFDTLPAGEAPRVVQRPSVRAMSDSSPDRKTPNNHIRSSFPSQSGNDTDVVKPSGGSSTETSPKLGDRMDSSRKSKRTSDKEVVEFDPQKKKAFRVTSMKRKFDNTDSPDGEINGGMSSSEGSPVKGKEFDISGEEVSSESYAVVNLADKKKYRAEADILKSEGSGVPQHYRPPVVRSEAEAIAAM